MPSLSPASPYIALLQSSHNLVLTGAPGTGKTHLAHAIAQAMGAETAFVQFHPSYDYTDFVEGLRPVGNGEGQIGFERRDGAFKAFCKCALQNWEEAQLSAQQLEESRTWPDRLEEFLEAAIDQATSYQLKGSASYTIQENQAQQFVVVNENNAKTREIKVKKDIILDLLTKDIRLEQVSDIKEFYKRPHNTQEDSYIFSIIQELRKIKATRHAQPVQKEKVRPFVFIIDEINRGEVAKIFGELFFALDLGYRGNANYRIQTQYQNLVPETDAFANGFYVPSNVYIIATMNDIDRSVESMDFAIRRRFTWKEVKPEDTMSMLDTLACAEQAKAAMRRLNEQIAQSELLGTAYQIGAAYFRHLEHNGGDFDALWTLHLEPLLREYLRGYRQTEAIIAQLKQCYWGDAATGTDSLQDSGHED